jgi:hypothetical protein
MLKRLTRKIFTLAVLCGALLTVASAPAPAAKRVFCMDAPLEMGCASGIMCCVEYDQLCTCA